MLARLAQSEAGVLPGPPCDAQGGAPSRPTIVGQRVEPRVGGSVVGNAGMRQKRPDRGEQYEKIEVREQPIQELRGSHL